MGPNLHLSIMNRADDRKHVLAQFSIYPPHPLSLSCLEPVWDNELKHSM